MQNINRNTELNLLLFVPRSPKNLVVRNMDQKSFLVKQLGHDNISNEGPIRNSNYTCFYMPRMTDLRFKLR